MSSYHDFSASEPAEGSIANQVSYQYDTNGNLVNEYQEHNGAVQSSQSLYVAYGYDSAATGYRPTTLQYPTTAVNTTNPSRVLTDSYGASGTDYEINQLDSIIDGTGTAASPTLGATLDTLGYLGSGAIVSEEYTGSIGLDIGYNLLATTDRSDQKPDIDQFGRVVDQVWNDYATGGNLLDGYQYTYNLQGDVASKQNLYKTAYPTSTAPYLDESYTYDQQDQLLSLTRGQLNTANDQVISQHGDLPAELDAGRHGELGEVHRAAGDAGRPDAERRSGPHAQRGQRDPGPEPDCRQLGRAAVRQWQRRRRQHDDRAAAGQRSDRPDLRLRRLEPAGFRHERLDRVGRVLLRWAESFDRDPERFRQWRCPGGDARLLCGRSVVGDPRRHRRGGRGGHGRLALCRIISTSGRPARRMRRSCATPTAAARSCRAIGSTT